MVYILACNDTLGTCCSDTALATIVNIFKIVIEMIQVIAPIILIIMAAIQLTKMMIDPDDPKDIKKKTLYNKFIAAVIIFFLPLMANLVLAITEIGVGKSANLEVLSCFKSSATAKPTLSGGTYQKRSDSKNKVKIIAEKNFDKGITGNAKINYKGSNDTSPTAKNLLASLEKMSNFVKNDRKYRWYYEWHGSSKTFEQANKTNHPYLVCSILPVWGLRDIGVLDQNEWVNQSRAGNITFSKGGEAAIKKHATIYRFSRDLTLTEVQNKIGLKPGDIVFWRFYHVNIYAGKSSNGSYMWYDTGRGGDGSWKNGRFYFNSFGPVKNNYKVKMSALIRLN